MNQLKEVTFINAASLPYSNIEVDGNTLFSGRNGAGKTTILRAVLYFYGAHRSEHLGISRNRKKRFEEYYFSKSNSYLVYKFSNDFGNVLAIVYKAGGVKLKYRFALETDGVDMKELFFEGNTAKDPKDLWNGLIKHGYTLSPVLQSPKEYRVFLYGQDHANLQYSLIRANSEYEQIAKMLSNIFVNSKLDSGSIKKSIVSSITGFDPIDLGLLEKNIKDFSVKYDDIVAFEKNQEAIHEAVQTLGALEEQILETQSVISQLDSNAKANEISLKELSSLEKDFEHQLRQLREDFNLLEEKHNGVREFQLQEQAVLENSIKEARSKRKEYEAQDIEGKLKAWDEKPTLESELLALTSQKDQLTNEHGSIAEQFASLRLDEQKAFDHLEQTLLAQINALQANFNQEQAKILALKHEALQAHQTKVDEGIESYNQELSLAREFMHKAASKKEVLESTPFHNQAIVTAKEQMQEAKEAWDEAKNAMVLQRSNLETLQEKVSGIEAQISFDIEKLSLEANQKRQNLEREKDHLQKQVEALEGSFFEFVSKYKSDHQSNLSKLLRPEVLLSDQLNPEQVDESETLFGISIDLDTLPENALDQATLLEAMRLIEEQLAHLEKQYMQEKEHAENTVRNELNALKREEAELRDQIDVLSRDLPKLEEQYLKTQEHNHELENSAENSKEKALLESQKELLSRQEAVDILEARIISFKNDLLEEKTGLNEKFTLQEREAYDNMQKERLQKETDLETAKKKFVTKLDEIATNEKQALDSGGVDTALLEKYQMDIAKTLGRLREIESFGQLIAEYKIDKDRLFRTLLDKESDLTQLQDKIKSESLAFQVEKQRFSEEKNSLTSSESSSKQQIKSLSDDLQKYETFKESDFYQSLDLSVLNQEVEADDQGLANLIEKLRELQNSELRSRDKLRKKLNAAFSAISYHNIFNLSPAKNDDNQAVIDAAKSLQTFVLEGKIETFKEEIAKEYTITLRHLSTETGELLQAEGDIIKIVDRINKTLQDLQGIKVVESVELRYKESDNALLNRLKAIQELVEEIPFGAERNLFSDAADEAFNKKALKLLDKLIDDLNQEKSDILSVDDSFVLEFRAVENGHDTGFVPSLDGIGSNGTDVMVKAMVNIAMLSLARAQSSKKDAEVYFHCILDEVGILSPNYLKELIEYANNKQIRFINGAPDEKLVTTYKRLYMLTTNNAHQTMVRRLLVQK